MTSSQLDNLNEPQAAAVAHNQGPILVLAGAGSGKTRVLTRRVAHLILEHGVRPEEILAVTFTNKATEEMRERLRHLLGERSDQIWIATFHSACLRILRRHASSIGYKNGFIVYDTDDSLAVIKQILKRLGFEGDKAEKPGVFLKRIDQLKNENISAEDFIPNKNERDQLVAKIYDLYQRELLQANAMDFTDLLVNTLKLLEGNKEIRALYQRHLQHILVDEFQDTNIIQYKIIRYLAHPKNNLLVVGDDDQSIYAFRGADIRNILSFENDFPDTKVVKLEQNYRSTQNILDAAFEVICKNKERKAKKLWTAEPAGDLITCFSAADEESEAEFIKDKIIEATVKDKNYKNFAIFYRTNAQSRALEESLIRAKIPYKIFGGLRFYERREIKDILAYLRLIHNPNDNQAFGRILNVPRRGIGAQTFATIQDFALQKNISLLEASSTMNSKSAAVRDFSELMRTLTEVSKSATLAEVIKQIFEKTKYKEQFADKKDLQNVDRLENLAELEHVAQSYSGSENGLQDFLDKVVLTTAVDNASKDMADSENYVSLMTLHLAKGLEFDIVFLTGLEEGLLPHSRSIEDGDIAEERRLCYVGITRARKKLYLTHARSRGFTSAASSFGYGGGFRYESRFLTDIPVALLDYQSGASDEFYQEEDEDVPEEYLYNSFRRKPKKKTKLDLKNIVSPADKLD